MTIPSKYSQGEAVLGFSMIPSIGARTLRKLFADEGISVSKLNRRQLSALNEFDWQKVDDELAFMSKRGGGYITFLDETYPDGLKNIVDFPPVLFYKGNLSLLNSPLLAIVGTRKVSDYGKQCVRKLVETFVSNGITVVSGMAFGVDAETHNCVLENKGSTIAVLASGVDIPSPSTNTRIYNRIINNGGLILSEQRFGTKPVPGFFPSRNRIISGLSRATIIIEAGQRSGALITAYQAFEQNREVYAIPGDITFNRSKGTNKIIREGIAKLLTSGEEVLEDLGYVMGDSNGRKELNFENELEHAIYNLLSDGRRNIDEICVSLDCEVSEVLRSLTSMELKGMVACVNSKYCLSL